MISFHNITHRYGNRIIFNGLNWSINPKQRIGIVGPNGTGKTTLFNLLLGKLETEKGHIDFSKNTVFGHVEQELQRTNCTALDYVLDGDIKLRELEHQLVKAEELNDGEKIASIHAQLIDWDVYSANSRAAQLLCGLGFTYEDQQRSITQFSGGWRVRLHLARALMCPSDILLLDEPTNHLDLDAVIWLQSWLKKYSGTLLIISHDRDFLDSTVDYIAHLTQQQLSVYKGNYSSFEKQRAEILLRQQAAFEKQQKHIQHLQSFIDRFRAKATKAKQAQSRVKALEKLDLISAVKIDTHFEFHFKKPERCPNPLIKLEEVDIGYDQNTIIQDLTISISPKVRMGLLGPNGAGKSSFIKVLAGHIDILKGLREVSEGVKIGYFAQHQVDQLDLTANPLQELSRLAPLNKEEELRTYLGGFGFSGDRVKDKIENLSGGEKSRLALALIIWQKPNLLLLDEPTNHLDLDMRHALTLAIQEYEGAMILVSHDRFLLRATVDQFYLVAEKKVSEFDGDISDYENWLIDFRKNENTKRQDKPAISKKNIRQVEARNRELRKPLQKQLHHLEKKLIALEVELKELEKKLTSESLYQDEMKGDLQMCLKRQSYLKKEMHGAESDWFNLSNQLEQMVNEEDTNP